MGAPMARRLLGRPPPRYGTAQPAAAAAAEGAAVADRQTQAGAAAEFVIAMLSTLTRCEVVLGETVWRRLARVMYRHVDRWP